VWDAGTGKELIKLTNHQDFVQAVALQENCEMAASAGWDKDIIIWNM